MHLTRDCHLLARFEILEVVLTKESILLGREAFCIGVQVLTFGCSLLDTSAAPFLKHFSVQEPPTIIVHIPRNPCL